VRLRLWYGLEKRKLNVMKRLRCLLVFCLSAFTLLAAGQRPNIVFIFSDDHALEAISAYGGTRIQTPQIDRLGTEGALFRQSFCANSICGPSRASILTGKHSHANGFRRNGDRFDGSQVTFPKLLQSAGYQTALLGKWHLETDPTGFDYWEVLPGQGHYYNPDLIQMDGSRKRYPGYCTDLVTDLSIEWLEQQRDPDRPFLLMIQHKAPHRNWSPALRHLDLFKDRDLPEPSTLFDDYAGRSRLLQENEMSIRDHFHWAHDMKFHGENQFPDHFVSGIANGEYQRMTPEQKAAWDAHYEPENAAFLARMRAGELSDADIVRWKYQRYIKDYLGCIAAVDENVGRVLAHLDASGLADNTVVIYSSDQGFYLGEHGWYDKRWMFEESLSMPFLIRWPGVITPGQRPDALIQNIDYAPTFLEMAGVPVPAEMQGRSFVPILRNGQAPSDWRDAIYYAYYENAAVHSVPEHDGVRTDRYKLMHFPRTREWQLFDLETDPQELRSVHGDPAYAPILGGLQKRRQDLRAFYGVNSGIIPATRGDEGWWRDRDRAKSQEVRDGDHALAFIGDSITQGWEGAGKEVWKAHFESRNAVNLGFSGDRTEHVLWRLTRSHPRALKPKVAVLMIGTNNTGHQMQDPLEVAEGIRQILETLAENTPETRVLLLGIFPRGASPWDQGRLNNIAINQIIRRFADGDRVQYLDLAPVFLEPDGSLSTDVMPDHLHLNAEGYRRWAEAINPVLLDLGI
jgi:arylsulfatase A-like enzyme/lysophospholipase L1-like esterase